MPTATLDVDPDVYVAVGRAFLDVNQAVCDIVTAAANSANSAEGMAGADSTGAAWARGYDAAADALLRAGATVVDALGVVGDRLSVGGANHGYAEAASVPQAGSGGPPHYPGTPGTSRAVGVVVSTPPSADGTPTDPPPGWLLIAHLLAWTWPAGHPDQLRDVGTGWLTASLELSAEADRLSGPLADLSSQTSPEVPYALTMCGGLQSALRTLADQYAAVAQACAGYANFLAKAHHDVISELVELVAFEAVVEIIGAVAAAPTAGTAEVPTQSVAGARLAATAFRVGKILTELAEDVVTVENLVGAVTERVLDVLAQLQTVTAARDTLQAVTALVDAGVPPVDLQANEDNNPYAHVMSSTSPSPTATSSDATSARCVDVHLAGGSYHGDLDPRSPRTPDRSQLARRHRRQLDLSGPLPPGAGRSYLRDSGHLSSATRFTVLLRRNAHGYFIFTVFPEP